MELGKYTYIFDNFIKFKLSKEISKRRINSKLHKQVKEELISVLGETYCLAFNTYASKHTTDSSLQSYLYGAFKNSIEEYFYEFIKHKEKVKYMEIEKLEELSELEVEDRTPAKNALGKELSWDSFDFRELTKRELEVLCFIYLADKSIKELADIYSTSSENIRKIKQRILDKLEISKINQQLSRG